MFFIFVNCVSFDLISILRTVRRLKPLVARVAQPFWVANLLLLFTVMYGAVVSTCFCNP
jgi:hypothetical protein